MKPILLATLLAAASTIAVAQDISVTIQQEARKCAKALVAADYDNVVNYTYKPVVEGLGGKDAMIAMLKRGAAKMHSQGDSIDDATIGVPEKPQKIGRWLVALVPQHLIMTVPGGHLELDSHLLGISEDEGKKWAFVDLGAMAKENFAKLFPEFAAKVDFPERKQPVFKKD